MNVATPTTKTCRCTCNQTREIIALGLFIYRADENMLTATASKKTSVSSRWVQVRCRDFAAGGHIFK